MRASKWLFLIVLCVVIFGGLGALVSVYFRNQPKKAEPLSVGEPPATRQELPMKETTPSQPLYGLPTQHGLYLSDSATLEGAQHIPLGDLLTLDRSSYALKSDAVQRRFVLVGWDSTPRTGYSIIERQLVVHSEDHAFRIGGLSPRGLVISELDLQGYSEHLGQGFYIRSFFMARPLQKMDAPPEISLL